MSRRLAASIAYVTVGFLCGVIAGWSIGTRPTTSSDILVEIAAETVFPFYPDTVVTSRLFYIADGQVEIITEAISVRSPTALYLNANDDGSVNMRIQWLIVEERFRNDTSSYHLQIEGPPRGRMSGSDATYGKLGESLVVNGFPFDINEDEGKDVLVYTKGNQNVYEVPDLTVQKLAQENGNFIALVINVKLHNG